jgi:hypothetical protein
MIVFLSGNAAASFSHQQSSGVVVQLRRGEGQKMKMSETLLGFEKETRTRRSFWMQVPHLPRAARVRASERAAVLKYFCTFSLLCALEGITLRHTAPPAADDASVPPAGGLINFSAPRQLFWSRISKPKLLFVPPSNSKRHPKSGGSETKNVLATTNYNPNHIIVTDCLFRF